MLDRAVRKNEEVGCSSLNYVHKRQPASAGAPPGGQSPHIACLVPNEGHPVCVEMRHHNFTRGSLRYRPAMFENFHDHIFRRDVHASLWTLVGDEAGFAAAISVGHGYAKVLFQKQPIVPVTNLSGDEYCP